MIKVKGIIRTLCVVCATANIACSNRQDTPGSVAKQARAVPSAVSGKSARSLPGEDPVLEQGEDGKGDVAGSEKPRSFLAAGKHPFVKLKQNV